MTTVLYLAPATSGKTAYLIDRARRVARGGAVSPRVIVPTRLQARAWRERLARGGGALGVRVGTFDNVYEEVLRAAGVVVTRLTDPVQVRLLRALAGAAPLSYYAPLRTAPGFIQMLRDLFAELKAGGIFPEKLAEAVAEMGGEPRLTELAQLYDSYQVWLQDQGWADYAGIGWLAAEALESNPEIAEGWPCVLVDGFDDLTTVQLQVLKGMAGRVDQMIITLTGTVEGESRPLVHKRFLRTRQRLEMELGLGARPLPVRRGDSHERGDAISDSASIGLALPAPALRHLERTLYAAPRQQPRQRLDDAVGVTLIAAPDREAEVREALRWLKQRLVIDGTRPGEVALLARSLEPYRAFIVQTAEEFGLPIHVLSGQPLRSNPAVAAVLALLTLVVPGEAHLTWRETVAAWRSPYFDWVAAASQPATAPVGSEAAVAGAIGITAEDAEMLELIARWASVIGGHGQWEAAFSWLRGPGSPAGSLYEEAPALPEALPTGEAAEVLWQIFERFVARTAPPEGRRSSAEHVAWVEALIGDVKPPEDGPPFPDLGVARRALTGPAGAAPAGVALASAELGARDEAALSALKDVLRGLVRAEAAVGGTPVSFPDFLGDLIAAVEASTYHLPLPMDAEAVVAADVHQARGVAFRAVAVLGMAEGEFPATSAEDPLLRDADREVLRDTFGMAVDRSAESIETQAFYEAITRPREALLLTRPRIADNGAPWQPSPYWEEVRRRVAVTPRDLTSADRPAPPHAASWPELLQVLAASAEQACAALGWEWARKRRTADTGRIARAQTILRQRSGAGSAAPALADSGSVDSGAVDPGAAAYDGDLMRWHAAFAEAYAPNHTWSASRLESYRTCPYFYFAGNVLRLEPRPLPAEGLDARQLGNIYHHIFETLTRRAGRDADLAALLDALPAVAGEILDAAPRAEQFRETAWWQQTRAEIQDNVARSLRALDALGGDFVFYAAEQTFGIPGRPGETLVVRDGAGDSFRLRGFIDRVDRAPNGSLRIIDYKTAAKYQYTPAAVRKGKKLQLPLYALAAQDALRLGDVVEGFYWHVRQAEPSSFTMARFRSDEGTGPAAAIACAVAMAWQAVRGARAGYFVPKAPDGGCPDYCPAAAFCWHYTARTWG